MGIEENRLASATGGREANLKSRRGCAKPVRWTQGERQTGRRRPLHRRPMCVGRYFRKRRCRGLSYNAVAFAEAIGDRLPDNRAGPGRQHRLREGRAILPSTVTIHSPVC